MTLYPLETSASFFGSGSSDYDAQTVANTRGELVAIYSTDDGSSRGNAWARYSTDSGVTWSSRTALLSNATAANGIISKSTAVMWEWSLRVKDDILYMVFHGHPGATTRLWFSKCDICWASNITVFSNWKSANNTTSTRCAQS